LRLPGPDLIGLVYGCSEIALSVLKRSRGAVTRADGRSLRMLWMVILSSVVVSVLAPSMVPAAHSRLLEILYPVGLLLFVLGLALRWWAIVHLGRFFTVDVAIAADHQVIDTGPYGRIRHPSYTGAIVAFAGYGVCLGNWVSLLAVTLPVALAFVRRIDIEEGALNSALGEKYRAYTGRTRRLFPGIY
jgi:protein-S-isoprenylcysteine O-methyltransferase